MDINKTLDRFAIMTLAELEMRGMQEAHEVAVQERDAARADVLAAFEEMLGAVSEMVGECQRARLCHMGEFKVRTPQIDEHMVERWAKLVEPPKGGAMDDYMDEFMSISEIDQEAHVDKLDKLSEKMLGIFGYKVNQHKNGYCYIEGPTGSIGGYLTPEAAYRHEANPVFSIAAAWELVKEMHESGVVTIQASFKPHKWICGISMDNVSLDEICGSGETVQEAICRAWLAWHEANVKAAE
jgi:hypothetical protein